MSYVAVLQGSDDREDASQSERITAVGHRDEWLSVRDGVGVDAKRQH